MSRGRGQCEQGAGAATGVSKGSTALCGSHQHVIRLQHIGRVDAVVVGIVLIARLHLEQNIHNEFS